MMKVEISGTHHQFNCLVELIDSAIKSSTNRRARAALDRLAAEIEEHCDEGPLVLDLREILKD